MEKREKLSLEAIPVKRTIVTLCGSNKFKETFQKLQLEETLAGRIVLTIGCATQPDSELFQQLSPEAFEKTKTALDALHMDKIAISHEILVLNVGRYVGESTSREIAYAYQLGKKIRYLIEPGEIDMPWVHYRKWESDKYYASLTHNAAPRLCFFEGCPNPQAGGPCALCYE